MHRPVNGAALARVSTTCYVKIISFQSPQALSTVKPGKPHRPTADFSRGGGFVVHDGNSFLFAQKIYALIHIAIGNNLFGMQFFKCTQYL